LRLFPYSNQNEDGGNPVSASSSSSSSLPTKAAGAAAGSFRDDEESDTPAASLIDPDLHVIMMTHAEATSSCNVFSDVRPAYVVLCDPDVTLIRNMETYQANNSRGHAEPLRVYFILYGTIRWF
jgi:hypothetical protein